MPPKLMTFPLLADQQRNAVRAKPTLDPVDLVAAANPQLADYDCIALPIVPCAESVLRLALALRDTPKQKLSEFDIASIAPPLQVRCPQATVKELTRRMERLQMADFPIYTLMPPTPGQPPEFALVDPKAMRPRSDYWSIVYIPPTGGAAAHWTFTTVVPTATAEPQVEPIIVYTTMPITELSETVYWRCQPTRTNMEAYEKKKALKQACHCCMQLPCVHQYRFLRKHPKARILVMMENKCFDGCWRGEVRKSSDMDGYKVRLAPGGTVVVANEQGQKSYHASAWNVPAVKRPAIEVGDSVIPVVADSFCWSGGFITMMPRVIRPLIRVVMRVNNTWSEKLWPFFYWKYDIADKTEFLILRPYVLKLYKLERRRRGFLGSCIATTFAFTKTVLMAGLSGVCMTQVPDSPVTMSLTCAWCMYQALRSSVSLLGNCIATVAAAVGFHFMTIMDVPQAERDFGAVVGTTLDIPKMSEVNSRLAVRHQRPREIATDVFRRAMNETRWATTVSPEEFETWLDTVVNTPGESPSIPPNQRGHCITCRKKGKTYRQECRRCKEMRKMFPPEPVLGEPLVTYIGRMGLWSRFFTPPPIELKECVVLKRGKKTLELDELLFEIDRMDVEISCRGWNSGPMIDSNLPQCFPRGTPTAVIAFLIRLGTRRLHEAQDRPWRLWFKYISRYVVPLEVETRQQFLEHFSGEKKQKMIDAFQSIDEGYAVQLNPMGPECACTGFTKAEKSYAYKLPDACSFEYKAQEKPRFICCPSPEFLAEIGPYTHTQLKWLSGTFTHVNHLFYAGCATPEEMNQWLNWTLSELPEPVTITDDITAIDSNHSPIGMEYHARLRHKMFPFLSPRIELLYESETNIKVRVGPYTFQVSNINGSGVPDTSYKNSAPCLILRVLAILYAIFDLEDMADEEILHLLGQLIKLVYTSAAGDDGITRMPRMMFGKDTMTPEFKARYEEFWAEAGFTVKVQVFPEHRWRMATYLAMRPVWGGCDYQWAPEPARRLKGMFWQIDNTMHPTAWGRGVATQVLQQGRHCPVLSDICQWYLENTSGPTGEGERRMYSPWDKYITTGTKNRRAEEEFMADYHIEPVELDLMRQVLARTKSVYVNMGFSALRRVMLEES